MEDEDNKNPILFHHVASTIVRFLDPSSTLSFALTCKAWAKALQMSKKSRLTLTFGHEPEKPEEDTRRIFSDIGTFLRNSPYGQTQTATVNYSWLDTTHFSEWMKEFGDHLTSLEIKVPPRPMTWEELSIGHSNINTDVLYQLLNNWSPNLEHLSLTVDPGPHFVWQIDFPNSNLSFPQPLKLISVHLNGETVLRLHYFSLALVKATPMLKVLHTRFKLNDNNELQNFYNGFKNIPGIMTNIREIRWDGSECRFTKRLEPELLGIFTNDMEFSPTFKSIGIGKCSFQKLKRFDDLTAFLAKVSLTLEALIIDGEFDRQKSNDRVDRKKFQAVLEARRKFGNWPDFPTMPRLTKLSNKKFSKMRVTDLKNFPSLKVLELGCNCFFYKTHGFIDLLFDDFDKESEKLGLKLEVLKLKQQIKNVSTLESLAIWFPGVTELWVTKQKSDLSTQEMLHVAASTSFKLIKKLKIYFKRFKWEDHDIRDALTVVSQFPELEELSLFVADVNVLTTGGLELAFDAPKLRCFRLGAYDALSTPGAVDVWNYLNELEIPLGRSIQLKVVNRDEFACCEGHLEYYNQGLMDYDDVNSDYSSGLDSD